WLRGRWLRPRESGSVIPGRMGPGDHLHQRWTITEQTRDAKQNRRIHNGFLTIPAAKLVPRHPGLCGVRRLCRALPQVIVVPAIAVTCPDQAYRLARPPE